MEKPIEIYTDGSCNWKTREGGFSFVVVDEDEIFYEQSGYENNTTVNVMELTAILEAMRWCILNDVNCPVKIFSDSQYAIKSITVWSEKKINKLKVHPEAIHSMNFANQELITEAFHTWKYSEIDFQINWIKAHNGNKWNEKADELANYIIGVDGKGIKIENVNY